MRRSGTVSVVAETLSQALAEKTELLFSAPVGSAGRQGEGRRWRLHRRSGVSVVVVEQDRHILASTRLFQVKRPEEDRFMFFLFDLSFSHGEVGSR